MSSSCDCSTLVSSGSARRPPRDAALTDIVVVNADGRGGRDDELLQPAITTPHSHRRRGVHVYRNVVDNGRAVRSSLIVGFINVSSAVT